MECARVPQLEEMRPMALAQAAKLALARGAARGWQAGQRLSALPQDVRRRALRQVGAATDWRVVRGRGGDVVGAPQHSRAAAHQHAHEVRRRLQVAHIDVRRREQLRAARHLLVAEERLPVAAPRRQREVANLRGAARREALPVLDLELVAADGPGARVEWRVQPQLLV
eukprot:5749432-Prymnesium_polylepis.1